MSPLAPHVAAAIARGQGGAAQAKPAGAVQAKPGPAPHVAAAIQAGRGGAAQPKLATGSLRPGTPAAHVAAAVAAGRSGTPPVQAKLPPFVRSPLPPSPPPRAPAPAASRLLPPSPGVIQRMQLDYSDLDVGSTYMVGGVARKLLSKGYGWLQFQGLTSKVRASAVTSLALTTTTTTVNPPPSGGGQITVYSDYPHYSDEYSDSEDDLESDYEQEIGTKYKQPQAKKGGYKKVQVKLFNATKWHPQKNIRELDIDNVVRSKSSWPSLEDDAQTIQALGGGSRPEAFTVVCAVVLTSTKALKKLCFSNLECTFPKSSREKAHQLGYHVIYTNQAHAEAEMSAYTESRGWGVIAIGCDKPHCSECNNLMYQIKKERYSSESEVTETKVFRNYYTPPLVNLAWRGKVSEKSDKYRPSKEKGYKEKDYSKKVDLSNIQWVTGAKRKRDYYESPQEKNKHKKRRIN
ncbi:MAG TPA: hypothetical protein VF017_18010 [Thermoanaerobaculia bacterium]|nr:hypothetical protein [Thermoanaerobaculia bacterium]